MHPEEDEKLKHTHPVSPAGELVAGRFEILQLIGSGGMGRVFKARDTQMDRSVALKFLHSHKLQDRNAVQRLLREAQVLSELRHPNVCDIYQIAVLPEGGVYIVSEFIDGISLNQLLSREGPLGEARITEIFDQVLQAVQAAHDQGIVHRDLTPANILLTAAGEVKLIDFGIAKTLGDGEQQKLTATGVVIGTVAYMSPEQLQGGAVDARADLFSVACAMYEAAAGYLPWESADDLAALQKRLTAQPKPLPGKLSQRLQSVILQNLAVDRDSRCASATQMREVLLGRAPYTVPGKAAGKRKRTVAWAVALTAHFLLVVGAVTVYMSGYFRQQQTAEREEEDAEQVFGAALRNGTISLSGGKAAEALDQGQRALLQERRFHPTVQQTGEALALTYSALLALPGDGDGIQPQVMTDLENFVQVNWTVLAPYHRGTLIAALAYGYEKAGSNARDQATKDSMYAKSQTKLRQSVDVLLQDRDPRSRRVLENMNRVLTRLHLSFEKRILFYADVMQKAEKIPWLRQLASTKIVEAKRGLYQQQPDLSKRAQLIEQTLEFGLAEPCGGLFAVYADRAEMALSQRQWARAQQSYKPAEQGFRRLPAEQKTTEMAMLGNILMGEAVCEKELRHAQRSVPYYEEAIGILKKIPGHDLTVNAGLFDLGCVYFELHRFAEARATLQECIAGCQGKPALRSLQARSYAALGTTCRMQKDYAGAVHNWETAIDMHTSLLGANNPAVTVLKEAVARIKPLIKQPPAAEPPG